MYYVDDIQNHLTWCHMLGGGATGILGGAFAPLCPPGLNPVNHPNIPPKDTCTTHPLVHLSVCSVLTSISSLSQDGDHALSPEEQEVDLSSCVGIWRDN